jgi:PASTA domain
MASRAHPTLGVIKGAEWPDPLPVAVAGIVLLLACGVGLGLGKLAVHRHAAGRPPAVFRVRVPDVVGVPSTAAIATVRGAGLRVRTGRVPWDGSHVVLEEIPAPGAAVRSGTVVTLQIRCLAAPCS